MQKMKYHWMRKALLTFIAIGLWAWQGTSAQTVSAIAEVDSSMIFIGGQIDLRLQVSQPKDFPVSFPLFTDTITGAVEIVKAGKIDTLSTDNNRLVLQQTLRITSFDSGLHYIPPIVFEEASARLGQQVATNHLSLMVINPFEEVDPQKGIMDIKKPMQTPFLFAELYKYLPWVLGLLLLSGIITLLALKFLGRNVPIKLFVKETPVIPAHERALKELERIKSEKLWQSNRVKLYYSEVTDTLRHYIEERYQIHAMEQTSDEILRSFKTVDIEKKCLENLEQVLTTADLVKFAKYEPLPDANDLSMINAYFFVNQTKIEELKSLDEEKEALLEKERNETTSND